MTGTAPPYDMSAVSKFEQLVGKGLSLVEFAVPLADCGSPSCSFFGFPTAQMQAVRNYGAIPFLSWSSQSIPSSLSEPNFQLSDVINGTYDSAIRNFAAGAKAWGRPFFLRFNWEMNGNWFPWSEQTNGNKAGEYVAAWRHVHDIFTQVGATNTTWVWCPYVDPHHKENLGALYPGKAYVDWTCLDGYNWGPKSPSTPRPWMSFDQLFKTTYRRITKTIAPDKPMILGELASSDYGGSKPVWIRKMLTRLPWHYPRIHGLIWFDTNDRNTHWPLETSVKSTRAFSNGIGRRLFRRNIYANLETSPVPRPIPARRH